MRFVVGKLEQRVRKKVVTTTFAYDNNGNVIQKTVDGTTTTYVYDYANRLTALGVGGATTTYAYDWAGNRVSQTGTTTTYLYPFQWYSVASSTGSGAKYATTTDYVFNGDSLIATVDQQTASGNATGTAKTRYVHPDHLGSTNVVTDENGNVVQTLDFYPYGSTRVSVATSTNEKRKFIGQFTDDSTLSYLNARYYDNGRGQFLTQDPTFLAVDDPNRLQQFTQEQPKLLSDPQLLNSYGYGGDNPLTNKDPQGLWALRFGIARTIPGWGLTGEMGVQADLQGAEVYYGAGLAGGVGGISFGPPVTTADLSHQYSISTAAFAQGGAVASYEESTGMTYYPYSTRKPEPYQEASVGFPALELAGGAMAEVSAPIGTWFWAKPSVSYSYSLPRPQMVSSINNPTNGLTSSSQNFSISGGSSSSGASGLGQILSSLVSALQALSAVLSTYKSASSH
jgi:RHS repeat-associated protein